MESELLPCPFCGGGAGIEQNGRNQLTVRCFGKQSSGISGCGIKITQKVIRNTLEWLKQQLTKHWNTRRNKDTQVLAEVKEWAANVKKDADERGVVFAHANWPLIVIDKIKELQGE